MNIQYLPSPPNISRVETGAVQFGDDHTGLFIRGDNAICLKIRMEQLIEAFGTHPDPNVQAALWELQQYVDLIENNVRYKSL